MKTEEFLGLKLTKNNNGQMAIEAVLLMTVLLGMFLLVTKYVKDKKLLSKMVAGPMVSLHTMTGYGVWKSADSTGCKRPGQAGVSLGKCHPNSIARSLSSRAD